MSEQVSEEDLTESVDVPVEKATVDAYTTPQRQKRRHNSLEESQIDDLKHRSTEKLRLAWENIYHKFQDSHLQAQDEIYLGRRGVKGDRMRVVVDRGHLRSITEKTLEFGCFHIDEAEAIGCNEEGQHHNEKEDSLTLLTPLPTTFDRIEESDLTEFLKAEEERKHLYPLESENEMQQQEGDEEDEEQALFAPAKRLKIKKIKDPMNVCPGVGKCTKSLCFLCGGIGRQAVSVE